MTIVDKEERAQEEKTGRRGLPVSITENAIAKAKKYIKLFLERHGHINT